ncbi:MAG: polar amino acid transport system substrate-binding protein [Oleiphilaceae bacterium]|jgi:polar amino acid transport system substrate-binding protein
MPKYFPFLILILLCCSVKAENFIGHCRDRPPELLADGAHCTGPAAEMIETMLARLGHSISWHDVPWPRTLITAKEGGVDLLVRHSMNSDREQFLDAIPYGYRTREVAFYYKEDKELTFNNWKDLTNYRLGVRRASHYSDSFQENREFLDLTVVASTSQLAKMLIYDRIDIMLVSSDRAEDIEAVESIKGSIKKAEFKVINYNGRFISMPKKSPMIKHFGSLRAEMLKMRKSGEVSAIYQKYNVSPPEQPQIN